MLGYNMNSADKLYLLLILLAYSSFWYSSLRVFNQKTELNKKHRYLFKTLVTVTWLFSVYAYVAADERRWVGAGSVLVMVSLILFWISVRHIRHIPFAVIFDSKTPSHHESTGPYRLVRHPFYSSYVLVYGSLVLTTPSGILAGLSMAVIVYYVFAAKSEEAKFLNSSYRAKYLEYMKSTGMFFPNILKMFRRC